ncbi:protein-methionine-sulfoxide reductase heme-binding subunit MsrQ [Polynucleobacter sp. MWH-UH35A]|uniref:protein-methionine-sulfoxide reductase heme-binding subunit MsrQ n=1 Tax=Polynucleobacter sp. MWH-UH35A TaxID=1855619 RepID=UPI001BFED20E|nr:protein-methionine-sulfoxide reductase heme-binding subunit MsrQ [Polynucleobacter sp. MWH-UH35A]QWD60505.1 sulfoxide reductase heme-binding subunit YedZ [Polynucleobacter sp. MWH-UH35A]
MKLIKTAVFLLSLMPLARLVWLGSDDGLGANPIEFITRSTGTWALVFLCLTLVMTPLRLITGLAAWIRLRRMLGLFCFFYACIHFSIWFWLDQNLNLQSMWGDVMKRPFITMGFLTLVLLAPLAATSNQWAVRLLGRRWALLHKFVYLIACTAIVHYWWHKAGKNDLDTVSIYAAVILLLLACRLPFVKNVLQRRRS